MPIALDRHVDPSSAKSNMQAAMPARPGRSKIGYIVLLNVDGVDGLAGC